MSKVTIDDVKRLRLEQGDTLVLCIATADLAGVEHLSGEMRTAFPAHRTVVLGPAADLEVVSAAGKCQC